MRRVVHIAIASFFYALSITSTAYAEVVPSDIVVDIKPNDGITLLARGISFYFAVSEDWFDLPIEDRPPFSIVVAQLKGSDPFKQHIIRHNYDFIVV